MAIFKKSSQEEKKLPVSAKSATVPQAAILRIQRPHITEKALRLSEKNQYVFRVAPYATKNEIKKQVKKLYNVDVMRVRSIVGQEKQRRLRGVAGKKSITKKMIVTIKAGQKIDLGVR
jgi:large subunit ribosomal protein L23